MGTQKTGNKGKLIILIAAVVILAFIALINFITDILWFSEVGYLSVFFKRLVTELEIGIPLFVVLSGLSLVYLKGLKKNYFKKIESTEVVDEKRLNRLSWLIALVSRAVVAYSVADKLWLEGLKFANSTDFNLADPLFNNDISFYIFKLDFIQLLNEEILSTIVVYIVATLIYYVILLSVRTPEVFETEEGEQEEVFEENPFERKQESPFGGAFKSAADNPIFGFFEAMGKMGRFGGGAGGAGFGGPRQEQPRRPQQTKKNGLNAENLKSFVEIAQKSIIVVGIIFFVMVGINFFLRQYELLSSTTGVLYGAGFTDVNVTLWMLRAECVLALAAAVGFAYGILKKKFKTILIVPVIMIGVGLLGTGVGFVVQNWVVSPDEINKESEYLERNIEYTRSAYGLDNVTVKDFAASENLTLADINNNQETISNIRINDYQPVQTFYNQTQAIRQYYTFPDVDIDRYMINGEYTQTYLSTREIDETAIRSEWLNQHLKYTHGYGITLSRVDTITASGQPDVLIADIPPVSDVDEITIDRPEIYFGELTNNYVLVGTDEEEFDYPDGESNTYTMYEGNAGIKLNFLNKIVFAIKERSIKLLVSTNIDSDSKIIINRNIEERVQKIMPQLSYDSDPYMVIADGKLYWIIDAYTASSNYPYSEPFAEGTSVNYIRNSIKVVVDAYNGTTDFYIVDENDPIAMTYSGIYPTLFKTLDQMPESLQSHLRYPNTLFQIQANVYQRYHMSDVKVFYQGEDLWEIANEIYGTEERAMTPNYYIFKLPGEEKAEFINSIPYTPKNKKNMTGLLVARNDGEHYGEIVLFQLPKSRVVYGPMQVEAMIDQNAEISKEFSLWNSSGSTYTRGNMFVIPIEDSLLYVEPVYLEATNSSIPEVKRVIVVYGDKIAYEETLGEALASMFGSGSGITTDKPGAGSETGSSLTLEQLAKLADKAYNNAVAAQQSGDWASYGSYLTQLENYLNMMTADDEEDEE